MSKKTIEILNGLVAKRGVECFDDSSTYKYVSELALDADYIEQRKVIIALQSGVLRGLKKDDNCYAALQRLKEYAVWTDSLALDVLQSFALVKGFKINIKKIVVLDTYIFIKRPSILDFVCNKFDKTVIPITCIEELNYIKDHNKDLAIRREANLAISAINSYKSRISIDYKKYDAVNNDEKIYKSAESLCNNIDDIFVVSNDKNFKLLANNEKIKALNLDELDEEINKENNKNFSRQKSKLFIDSIAKNDKERFFNLLNDNEVDKNFVNPDDGLTPLITAIRAKNLVFCERLAKYNLVDLEKRDERKYFFTPLLHICQIKNSKMLKLMLDNGANPNTSSNGKNKGNTPLMVCAWGGWTEGVEILARQKNLIYNQQDNNGFTALHKA